jgi:RNA polymerase sigma-70 factor (ECF subfamily)
MVTHTADTASHSSHERAQHLSALLARTSLGDRRAFSELYQLSSAHLLGVILRIQRNRELAEDILQEVYVNVWRGAGSFDAQRAQPMTWLASVARNRAIDSLRRRQTEPDTVSTHRTGESEDDEYDMLQDIPSGAAAPHELLSQAAEALAVTHCMGSLSGEQQQSLALAFYQGLSHAEVAEHLSQPLGTVKSWVRRGLQALRDCLGRAGVTQSTSQG